MDLKAKSIDTEYGERTEHTEKSKSGIYGLFFHFLYGLFFLCALRVYRFCLCI